MVEAATGLPVFLMTLLVGLDILRLAYVSLALQFGVFEGGRYASLVQPGPTDPARIQQVINLIPQVSWMDVSKLNVQFCDLAAGTCTTDDPGSFERLMSIKASYSLNMLSLGGYSLSVKARSVYRNEPQVS